MLDHRRARQARQGKACGRRGVPTCTAATAPVLPSPHVGGACFLPGEWSLLMRMSRICVKMKVVKEALTTCLPNL